MNEAAVISHSSDILQRINSQRLRKTNFCVSVTKLVISHHLSSRSENLETRVCVKSAGISATQNTAGLTGVNCDELCARGPETIHLESKFTDGLWHTLRPTPALTSLLNLLIIYCG